MKKNNILTLALTLTLLFTGSIASFALTDGHKDFREESIYFVITDRFVDGDEKNNNIYGDEYVPGNLRYYQGGDFKGLIDNLDYIKGMGFTAIWITPPVKQPEGRYANKFGTYDAAGYHGYWAYDFSKIDPHLESRGATYKDLINAAHAKGLKIIQDVVINHGHGGDAGNTVKWYNNRGKIKGLGKTYDYFNDNKNWFNHTGENAIADLLDFNDNNPRVTKWLKKIYKKYQDMGVDAFRIDTAMWVSQEFLKDFTQTMHKNKSGFFMFGEIWTNDNFDMLGKYTRLSEGDSLVSGMSVLDMPLSSMGGWGRMEQVFKGGDYREAEYIFANDGKYKNATFLVTYLDNHDKPRFNSPYSPAYEQQYVDALNFYFTVRGIPCIYYGTELQMMGGDDPDNRAMLGIDGIKSGKTSTLYSYIKKLNDIRKSSVALQKGAQKTISSTKDSFVFRRDYKGDSAFVILNKGEAIFRLGLSMTEGKYKNLVNGEEITATDEITDLKVPAHGLAVLIPVK